MKGINFDFKVEYQGVNILIKVKGFKSSRPVPPCSNPSSPRFSDPGDPAEWDEIEMFHVTDSGELQPIQQITVDVIISEYEEEILFRGEDYIQSLIEQESI